MTAHEHLEQQLRASVARSRMPPQGASPSRWLGWSRGRSVLIVAASGAVALAVAVVALVALHHGRSPSPAPAVPATTTTRRGVGPRPGDPGSIPADVDDAVVANAWNTAWSKDPACRPAGSGGIGAGVTDATPNAAMLSALPVLRRRATSADHLPASLSFRSSGRLRVVAVGQGGEVYIRDVRRVRLAEGRAFYLVPIAKVGRPPLPAAAANRCDRLEVAALAAALSSVPVAERAPTRRYGDAEFAVGRYNLETSTVSDDDVALVEQDTNGSGAEGSGPQSLASIQQGGRLGGGGGGKPFTPIIMDGIVPTGIATVTLHFPAIRHARNRLPALNATGDVIDNVFVVAVPTLYQRGGWPTTAIWRTASGKVIKTINEVPFHP